METLREQYNLAFIWHSFELRPADAPPIPTWYLDQINQARPVFARSMKEELGIDINSGPFGINSRPSLVGAKYAEAEGAGDAYHWAILRAYWEEGQDISTRPVLREIAAEIGLDQAAFEAALGNPVFEAQVDADIQQAAAYGLSSVPSMIFAGKYLVVGAQPLPVLEQTIQEVHRREALD